ncbi:acyltransferase [Photobacterium phosphoreum]|uniref:acyltransferase n=1 Tax=Photobacterium phosphoreum TaxID=659 RepID=UPI001E580DA4|nr:hypothetical protein [Photobacterium phosphoreum]MCD9477838.1 hypothetical protein [Photobacterium phosphoreum]
MKLFKLLFKFLTEIVDVLAEIEFKFIVNSHSSKQYFRRLYLKLKAVNYIDKIYIGANFSIRTRGNITLGNRVSFGADTKLYSYAEIIVGDDFMSAKGLTINTGSHDQKTLEPFSAPVVIGNRVWCGMDVIILPGVCIGDDVCIGAGSIVTRNIPSNSVVAGVPAKIIRKIERHDVEIWRPEW